MTRREDFVQPWGREHSDDIIGLKIHENKYQAHRQYVREQQAHVDSSDPPSRLELDIFNSGKAPAIRRDRQRAIDSDNQKMVENMADILRKGGPTMRAANVRPYKKMVAPAEVMRRKKNDKIEAENRRIADRLRNQVKPEIDHKKQAQEYEKNVAVRKNISAAAKRAERTAKEKRIRTLKLNSMSFEDGATSGSSFDGDQDGSDIMNGTRGVTGLTKLRTAKDVRSKVAEERGDTLPNWLTSDRSMPLPTSSSSSSSQSMSSSSQYPRHQQNSLVLTHTGAPSAPMLMMPPFPMG